MEIEFPVYPFVWNYDDMYSKINYECDEINSDYDEHIQFLLTKFPNCKVINSTQTISKENCTNLNIHTWYLSQNNRCPFTKTNNIISITTNSQYKFKSNAKCFIFDPNNIFNNFQDNTQNYKGRNPTIAIIKKTCSVIPELIPMLYIHTHNVDGIFRFSPNDNSKIVFQDNFTEGVCYVVLDKLIVKLKIVIIAIKQDY